LDRCLRINAMQLPQIKTLCPQVPQTHLHLLRDVFRAAERHPLIRARTHKTSLGRNHKTFFIRSQSLADKNLADVRAIRIRCVDEVDAELDRTAQDTFGLLAILRLAPDSFACDAHRAEAQTMNLHITAEAEGGCD